MNEVTLVGPLVSGPALRRTASLTAVAHRRIAVTEGESFRMKEAKSRGGDRSPKT